MPTLTKENTETKHREDLKKVCHMAYKNGLVSGFDGNFSLKLDNGNILITPKGSHKGLIDEEDFVVVDLDGNILPVGKDMPWHVPSSDLLIHLAAYKKRPDINSFVHAHPPKVISLTVCGIDFNEPVLPDSIVQLGEVAFIPFPGPDRDEELKLTVSALEKHDVIILDRHGAVAVGKDIYDAFYKAELLEHTAEILFNAHTIGNIKTLEPKLIEELIKYRHRTFGRDVEAREGSQLFQNLKQAFKIKNLFKKLFENSSPVFQRILNLVKELLQTAIQNTKYSEQLSLEEKEQLSRELTASILSMLLGRFTKKS